MNRPTIKECFEYSNNMEQSIAFHTHFEAIDWMVGSKGNAKPMVKWKSAITGWIKRSKPKESKIETVVNSHKASIADRIWLRMKESFGEKFIREYGEVPTTPWINTIVNLSNEQIAHGLSETIKLGGDWAPSLGHFRRLCKSYREPIKALSHLPGKQEIMAQRERTADIRMNEMNKIRDMRGML